MYFNHWKKLIASSETRWMEVFFFFKKRNKFTAVVLRAKINAKLIEVITKE